MKQHIEQLTEDLRVSIVEYSEEHYELAVQYKLWSWSDWEIDYSKFKDVLTARSSMEVYGTIEYTIKDAYAKEIYGEEAY